MESRRISSSQNLLFSLHTFNTQNIFDKISTLIQVLLLEKMGLTTPLPKKDVYSAIFV
jgi:hypothetical protein